MVVRGVVVVLLAGLVLVEARLLLGGRAVVVEPVSTATEPAAVGADLESAFTAHMTADDVARGIYGLSAPGAPLPLTAEQRAAVAPLLEDGARLRAQLGELRMKRRERREAWLVTGAALAEARP